MYADKVKQGLGLPVSGSEKQYSEEVRSAIPTDTDAEFNAELGIELNAPEDDHTSDQSDCADSVADELAEEEEEEEKEVEKRGGLQDGDASCVAANLPPCYRGNNMYHLSIGKEIIQYNFTEGGGTHSLSCSNINHVSFFGKCYHCRYSAHSQKYCPLRFCKLCNEYGHSEIVCPSMLAE